VANKGGGRREHTATRLLAMALRWVVARCGAVVCGGQRWREEGGGSRLGGLGRLGGQGPQAGMTAWPMWGNGLDWPMGQFG
jgi:hypothetical protein